MKIYRQSIWKLELTWVRIPLLLSCIIVIMLNRDNVFLVLFLSLMFLILALSLPIQFFYLVITEDKVLIRNPIYRFYNKDFFVNNITKIEIGNTGGMTSNYIRIFTNEGKSKRYAIDLINKKEYSNLIKDIRSKKIKVEVSSKALRQKGIY